MAIDELYLTKMKHTIDTQFVAASKKNVVCLGYPDLLISKDLIEKLYGQTLVDSITIDSNQEKIQMWHKFAGTVYDPQCIFEFDNFNPTIIDKISHRGNEIVVDLNFEIDKSLHRQYDLCIDTGTLEHCFNAGTAFKNMCDLVKLNGVVMTAAPVSKINHGYYNFCPILHTDGFQSNGFEIVDHFYVSAKGHEVPAPNRKQGAANKLIMITIAKRVFEKEFEYPIQGKYK